VGLVRVDLVWLYYSKITEKRKFWHILSYKFY